MMDKLVLTSYERETSSVGQNQATEERRSVVKKCRGGTCRPYRKADWRHNRAVESSARNQTERCIHLGFYGRSRPSLFEKPKRPWLDGA
ncbi:hypothetical protein NCS52_01555600 [Fusarium sp. LHS14.1]|nr:hypothetical protein NCS52_01555600 [Fusarium sp. LHS14.1]